MTGKICSAAERYSSAPGWRPLRSSSSSSTSEGSRGLTGYVWLWQSKCLAVQAEHIVQACFLVRSDVCVSVCVCVWSHLYESLYCSFGQGHWDSALRERDMVTGLPCWLQTAHIKQSPLGLATFAESPRLGIVLVLFCWHQQEEVSNELDKQLSYWTFKSPPVWFRSLRVYLWPEAAWLCSVWAWSAVAVPSGPAWSLGFSCRWIASAGGSCRSRAAFGWISFQHTSIWSRTPCLLWGTGMI